MNLGHLDFDIVSDLELRISDFASLGIFTLVKSPLQISFFMQNKANFQKSQMNVTSFITKHYENKSNWTLGENKPNSNPIKANLLDAQMNISSVLTKYYENVRLHRRGENKPNQTQFQTQRFRLSHAIRDTHDAIRERLSTWRTHLFFVP